MSKRRILGIIVALGGIVMLFVSHYIQTQVDEGRGKISSAQKKVNQTSGLFSLSPATKGVGKSLSKSAQKSLDKYKKDADYYESLANGLEIGGWIIAALGAVLIFLPEQKKSRR